MFSSENASINQAIANTQLLEIAQSLEPQINGDFHEKISPFKIYCAATGQPIGNIATQTLHEILQFHGAEKTKNILHTLYITARHPLWINIANIRGDSNYNTLLDNLCNAQPYAACVYFMSLICAPKKLTNNTIHERAEFHWSLARAFSMLAVLNDVQELMEHLKLLAAYMPNEKLEKSILRSRLVPDNLARLAVSGSLVKTIKNILQEHTKETLEKADNWAAILHGPAHLISLETVRRHKERAQTNERRAQKEREIMAEINSVMSPEMFAATMAMIKKVPSAPSRFTRDNIAIEQKEAEKDAALDAQVDAFLASFDIAGTKAKTQHFGDKENEVEWRVIPRAAITPKNHRFIRNDETAKEPDYMRISEHEEQMPKITQPMEPQTPQEITPEIPVQKPSRFVRPASATKEPNLVNIRKGK